MKVEEAVSVAYGPGPLEPHMDIPMYESHVGITLLHCLRFVVWSRYCTAILLIAVCAIKQYSVLKHRDFHSSISTYPHQTLNNGGGIIDLNILCALLQQVFI